MCEFYFSRAYFTNYFFLFEKTLKFKQEKAITKNI